MNTLDLMLRLLHLHGCSLTLRPDGRVRLTAQRPIPADEVEALRPHLREAAGILLAVESRLPHFREQAKVPGPWPFLRLPDLEDTWEPGTCYSCAGPLDDTPIRCAPCTYAANVAFADARVRQ